MKKIILAVSLLAVIFFCFFAVPVIAETGDGLLTTADALKSVDKFSETVGIMKAKQDPRVLIGKIISVAVGVVGSLALVIVIYGGIMWMIAAGNETQMANAKKTIMWGVFGLLIVLLSYVIVRAILTKVIGISEL